MKPERWQQIDQLLEAALEKESNQRAAFLDQACAGDQALRQEVETLLAAHDQVEGFIEGPALQVAAKGIAEDQGQSLAGQSIGSYKIISLLGVGGMGEVYRAMDTKLEREVAIKVLPTEFSQDRQRLARFEREAKLLASLNHPNIAVLYGQEEVEEKRFLVLELVEGETLAERLAKGPLTVEEALEVCRQIAEGVEAAHEKGVIHRDLKPANVKITPEGRVKILDFGLAKALEDKLPAVDMSQSPTLTEEMTRAGVILGTAAYMSPEQAKGQEVDTRADIFAFGCVLYELLTGRGAFEGETVTETLAKILEGEPDWKATPQNIPTRIRELMEDCLEKDPDDRLRDIGNARIQIKRALKEPVPALPVTEVGVVQPLWKRAIPWSIAAVGIVIAGLAWWCITPSEATPLTELVITTSPTVSLDNSSGNELVISPDGRSVVFRAIDVGGYHLYLRNLDDVTAKRIAGTQNAGFGVFFSPDSKSIAFHTGVELRKVSLTGGPPTTICKTVGYRGGSWGADDIIVFAGESDAGRGLFRVPAGGGEPEVLTIADSQKGEGVYRTPEILPGGQAVLFEIFGTGNSKVALLSLKTGEQRVLLEGARQPHYTPTGHLVYSAASTTTLMAVAFDLDRLEIVGSPVPLPEQVRGDTLNMMDYALSSQGTLVYVPAGGNEYSLVWVDREGREQRVTEKNGEYLTPRVSPDGKQIALARREDEGGDNQVWIYDLRSESFRLFTFEGTANSRPIWSPDGQWITFTSDRDGSRQVYNKRADGTGQAERLITDPQFTSTGTNSYSHDGSILAVRVATRSDSADIWILPMEGDRQPRALITAPNTQRGAAFSPDGRWVAYGSTEMGQSQVYVSDYQEPDAKFLVSGEEGGAEPIWSPDGTELFYRSLNGDRVMAISVETEPTFSTGRTRVLFEGKYRTSDRSPGYPYYDITPDGQRFLMIKEEGSAQINVVLNWFEELKRLVPSN